jgi:regulator of sigma E protease
MLIESIMVKKIFFIFAGIGGISGLIFFHELGHFLFCKLFKIHTPSFSIGFGPEIFSRMIGKTRFILAAIPLGGYVEIAGMAEEPTSETTELTAPDKTYTFEEKPFYQKLLVMLGGILFNLLFSYTIFSMVHFFGAPATSLLYAETAIPVISTIVAESPAEKLGLQKGDIITAINAKEIDNIATSFRNYIPTNHTPTTFTIKRNEEVIEITLEPSETPTRLGVIFAQAQQPPLPLLQAIKKGITTTNRWITNTVLGFIHIFKNRDFSSAGGPIKIVSMIAQSASDGLFAYLLFLAIISVNLAIFNLFPAPILDGGQILICTIETIIGKRLPMKTKEYLFLGTWLLFLALIVYLSFQDLSGLIAPKLSCLMNCIRGQ